MRAGNFFFLRKRKQNKQKGAEDNEDYKTLDTSISSSRQLGDALTGRRYKGGGGGGRGASHVGTLKIGIRSPDYLAHRYNCT